MSDAVSAVDFLLKMGKVGTSLIRASEILARIYLPNLL